MADGTNLTRTLGEVGAAERLGLSPATLRKWRCQGRGPRFARLGRRILYRPADLDDFVLRNLVAGIDRGRTG
jgi:hypothetical protein